MKNYKKLLVATTASLLAFISLGASVSAHVVVKPAEVAPAAYQTFTVGVPNEKEIAVTALKLVIPKGVTAVTPTVKPGWTINTEKTGIGEAAAVTSITWTSGSVDAGLRDDFTFSAKTPAEAGEVEWKAYQTYADGTVTAWDQREEGGHDTKSDSSGPSSVTKVITVATEDNEDSARNTSAKNTAETAVFLAVAALLASGYAIWSASRRKS